MREHELGQVIHADLNDSLSEPSRKPNSQSAHEARTGPTNSYSNKQIIVLASLPTPPNILHGF